MSKCLSNVQLEECAESGAANDTVQEHLDSCRSCLAKLESIRSNNALLNELRPAHRSPDIPTHSPLATSAPSIAKAISGFQILSVIRRGGQGVVYKATQKATKRTVALKVLIEGAFATTRQRKRFEREIDLIAGLKHPNIVTVYDSGVTSDGQHYFAMEYVHGVPLDQYLRPKLTTPAAPPPVKPVEETLRLFATICAAVNYAHQRGVIHRDLKPGNILVDAAGEPHILDFGLAKAAGREVVDDGRPVTMTGDFLGTLAYASPEQTRGDPNLVDVRSDVYSLGVILYEMLTGQFPYGVTGNMQEVLRNINHAAPTPPRYLRAEVNDELGTIVIKALAKEPERRYQSADGLARDVRHYLAGEAIEAKRDSGWYVLKKTLRRYRVAVGVTAAFVVLITVSTLTLSVLYRQARAALTLVEAEHRQTLQEAEKAKQIQAFLRKMLASIDPERAEGRDITILRELLDEAAARVEAELADQPEVEAAVRDTIGTTYQALGLYESAELHLERALKIRRRVLGNAHPDTLESMSNRVALYYYQGRYEDGLRVARETLETCRRELGAQHLTTLNTLNTLAALYQQTGRYDEAESAYRQALAAHRERPASGRLDAATGMSNLAVLLRAKGDYLAAESLLHEALAIRRDLLGDEHVLVAIALNNLGALHYVRGHYAQAEARYREALAIRRRLLTDAHVLVAQSMNNLAAALRAQGKYAEAEPLYRQALTLRRRLLDPDHPDLAKSLNSLAGLLVNRRNYAAAEALYREALAIRRESLPESDWRTANTLSALGGCLTALERYEEAEPLLLEAYETIASARGEADRWTIAALQRIIDLYDAWGKPDKAADYRAKLPNATSG